MAVPCAVTALKYVEAVTKGAGSGLRAHICHTPRTSATANARNASQRWAKVSCLACVTSNPALGVRLEFIRRDDAYRCRHFAVAQATILVAWHEQVAGTREDGVNLAHVPWNDHVFTFVPLTRMPWITSGVAKRSVTRRLAGRTMQRGWHVNCVATIRLVT